MPIDAEESEVIDISKGKEGGRMKDAFPKCPPCYPSIPGKTGTVPGSSKSENISFPFRRQNTVHYGEKSKCADMSAMRQR
jgi:hypothetical protein